MTLINNTANTKVGMDGQTWRGLKQIDIVGFWKLSSLWSDSFSKFAFLVCNVWYNAWDMAYLLETKLWFSRLQVFSSLTLSSKAPKKAQLAMLTKNIWTRQSVTQLH